MTADALPTIQFPAFGEVGTPAGVWKTTTVVASANCTSSPLCNVSGWAIDHPILCSEGRRVTSTLSPKIAAELDRLECHFVCPSPRTATWAPRSTAINAVAGIRTMFGSPGIWKLTRQ